MPKRHIRPITTMEIDGILETTHRVVEVVQSSSGKSYKLPRRFIDFLPGRVIMPAWLYNKIHRKTMEGREDHKQ